MKHNSFSDIYVKTKNTDNPVLGMQDVDFVVLFISAHANTHYLVSVMDLYPSVSHSTNN